MGKPWSIGVIGPGLIWHATHKKVLQSMPERARVAAFAARRPETRAKAAADAPEAAVYEDYRELLRSSDVDAVAVLTPIPLNAPVTIQALEAGKHVLVEKPMGTSLAEAAAIREAERKSGRVVCVLEQVRYAEGLIQARRLIEEGRIGRVVSYDRVAHFRFAPDSPGGFGGTDWRIDPSYPLGTLFDGGIHDISELSYLFGPAAEVYARGTKLRETYGEYDHVLLTLTHESGVVGSYGHSGAMPSDRNYFYIRGTKGILRYTRSSIEIEGDEPASIPVAAANANARMWEHALDALEGRPTAMFYGAEAAERDVAALEAAAASLRTGKAVRL
ncbi:Gfo/Idh/MocA family oxidoreductase [Paenibacillus sp.]|uniref:Gfo/Idh/MocA family protein n=1 Tax=Paenibacillus sp. TaxID=58172 RepID=UPI002D61B0F7|nr:Gfo/Idh/MocA family oxidoreductase [Paenibacillus sp.]HZG57730.1 Gfo/Idh/MocA family oxidoreductase [Paenibacillus sp.]